MEGGWADIAGAGKILLWKGFPKGLVDDQVLGGTDADGPQTTGAGGEVEAVKDEGWLQPATAGLVVKTTGGPNPEDWPPTMAPGTTEVD